MKRWLGLHCHWNIFRYSYRLNLNTVKGCVKGWHGSADIIIEEVPVVIIKEDDADDERSVFSNEDKEEILSEKSKNRVLVETIVFSFMQRRENGETVNNCLIPGMGFGISLNVIIYFYNSENDVLISTMFLTFFSIVVRFYIRILLLSGWHSTTGSFVLESRKE